MPGLHSIRNLQADVPAVQEMAAVCLAADGAEMRADANETAFVSGALTSVTLEAIGYEYPELIFRQLAPLQQGITPGTETFTWEEFDIVGMADIIANYAQDLPSVSEFIKTNTGIVKSLGASFEYTKQDVRRVAEARRNGRGAVLDIDRVELARQMIERRKDLICAFGDATNNLPGVLKNANVTVLTAATPGVGGSKSWTAGLKTGGEMLKDLRAGLSAVAISSRDSHRVNTIVMSQEYRRALATTPLVPTTENQTTVLQEFVRSQNEMGEPVRLLTWTKCAKADAAGTGNRVLFMEVGPRVARLVEPMDFEADPPQRHAFTFKIPCEARFGGIVFKRTLGAAYMDFV
jgi:hypothetical protein